MNKSLLIPLSLGAIASAEAAREEFTQNIHRVSKDECFSSIVLKYIKKQHKEISYSSVAFKDAFERFKKLNPQIDDYAFIQENQEINIPVEFGR